MKWVTRKGVKFDRSACAWFIMRYVDKDATFDFLDGAAIQEAIDARAQAFHNYEWTGNPQTLPPDRVNFPKLIENHDYGQDPAMTMLAQTVRSAEQQGRTEDDAKNYGVWAIANGVYGLCDGDDMCIVERMLPVYDALYMYCQMQVNQQPGMTGH